MTRRQLESVFKHIWGMASEPSCLPPHIRWESAIDMLYGLRLVAASEGNTQQAEDCILLSHIAQRHAQNARLKAAA